MDFDLTAEQREIQALAREVADAEIAPHAAEWDREHRFPLEVIARLGELGLMGVCVPEEYGGAGAGFLAYVLVLEELSRADAGIGVSVAVHTSAATLPVLAWGTKEQCERLVPSLASGSTLGAFALTEPDVGSDAGALRAAAKRDGDGWLLSGQKQWVTNGGHAGHILALRAHEPGGGGWRRHLGFPARSVTRDRDAGGGEARPQLILHRRPAARQRTRRRRSAAGRGGARVRDRARRARRRPDRHRRPGGRYRTGRLRHRSRVCRRAQTFGRPLVHHQAIETKLVNMAVEIEAARLLTYRAAG